MAWENRDYNQDGGGNGGVPKLIFPMPSWLTLGLIVSNLVIFLADGFTRNSLLKAGALPFPGSVAWSQPWRWFTYPYLHGDGLQIFFNLIAIYFFVPGVERIWGWKKSLIFYTLGALATGLTACLLSFILGWPVLLLGAGGAILSLLGAMTFISPEAQIIAIVFPLTMRTFSILISILYLLMTLHDRDPSSAAHLGGLAFGYFALKAFGQQFNLLGLESWQVPEKKPWRSKFGGAVSKQKKVEKLRQAERDEQQQIDAILAKVSASGMQSLTFLEKRALKKATENQRKRDSDLAALRRE